MKLSAIATSAMGTLLVTVSAVADPDAFWTSMRTLCGNAYQGAMTHIRGEAVSVDHWPQVLHVHRCEDDRIYMRFIQDRMPNHWHRILIRHENGRLELRHDYRDPDGTPSEDGDYGGFTPNPGSATMQIFPADPHTTGMASKNWPRPWVRVWILEARPSEAFAYSGVNVDSPASVVRFEFDLSEIVEAPSPWSWE